MVTQESGRAGPIGGDHHFIAHFDGAEQCFQHLFHHVQAATRNFLPNTRIFIAAVDSEAVPTEFAIVSVKRKGLFHAVERCQAHIADAIFTNFTITAEVNCIHVAKERCLELSFTLAGLLNQSRIHLEAILAENGIHLEPTQWRVALFKAAAGASDAIAAKTHLEEGAIVASGQHAETPGWIVQIQLNLDRPGDPGGGLTHRLLRRTTAQQQANTHQGKQRQVAH